jgi:hypothetical protein
MASNNNAAGGLVGYTAAATNVTPLTINNCYAAGSIVESGNVAYNFAGILGKVGTTDESATNIVVSNSVALQLSIAITSTGNLSSTNKGRINRVKGYIPANGTLTNNYGRTDMSVIIDGKSESKTSTDATSVNGKNVAFADAKTATWYAANLPSWDFTNMWTITDGELPHLKWETAGSGTAINPVDANDAIVATKYYNLLGIEVSANALGVIIIKNIHASGKMSTSKLLKITP